MARACPGLSRVGAKHAPEREGTYGTGCSSSSSWARCCRCSVGRKSKGWVRSGLRPGDSASNHLAVADSFFLPLVVRRRITGSGQGGVLHRHGHQRLVHPLVLYRGRTGADRPG